MISQALITKSVIDGALRFPQLTEMLTHDEILAELKRQLADKTVSGAAVARKLNIAPARVTEMKNDERRIQQTEMPALAAFLGMVADTPTTKIKDIESTEDITSLGRVAQGVWLEQSMAEPDPRDLPRVAYDRVKGDPSAKDLFAVEPEGTSMNVPFPLPNMQLICRRVPFGDGNFKSGDLAIVQRTAHDLCELTCKRVRIDDEGVFWLHCESTDPQYRDVSWRIGKPDEAHHNDIEVTFIGKVLRAVVNYSA